MNKYKIFATLFLMVFPLLLSGCSTMNADNQETERSNIQETENAGKPSEQEESSEDDITYYTKYADYSPRAAEAEEMTAGTNGNILVAYFSRSGNTEIPEGMDAVSSASYTVNEDGTTMGNAQRIAEWIAGETGGDLFLIQTEYTYPYDYEQAVSVGEGQDMDGYHPKLISHVDDMGKYDTIFLVYPIWHFTLSAPTCSFLDEYDLSGKTVCLFAANAGSGFADSAEVIRKAEPDAEVIEGISVSQSEMDNAETEGRVVRKVRELMENTERREDAAMRMNVQIGDYTFTASMEENKAADELAAMMKEKPVTIEMSDYSGFEKVGSLGKALSTSDEQTTTSAGDIVLYNGNQIVIFYGSNSWSYTRLARIDDLSNWEKALGGENVTVTFSAAE